MPRSLQSSISKVRPFQSVNLFQAVYMVCHVVYNDVILSLRGAIMMINFIHSMDLLIHHSIQNQFRHVPMDQLMAAFTRLGDYGALWVILAIGLMLFPKTRTLGLLILISLMVTAALGEGIIKHLVQRPRPPLPAATSLLLHQIPSTFSFPSGHTASSFAAATTLFRWKAPPARRWFFLILIYLIAGTIAFSRLYLGLHYFTDIVGGVALGILCSLWVTQKIKPALKK